MIFYSFFWAKFQQPTRLSPFANAHRPQRKKMPEKKATIKNKHLLTRHIFSSAVD